MFCKLSEAVTAAVLRICTLSTQTERGTCRKRQAFVRKMIWAKETTPCPGCVAAGRHGPSWRGKGTVLGPDLGGAGVHGKITEGMHRRVWRGGQGCRALRSAGSSWQTLPDGRAGKGHPAAQHADKQMLC